MTGTGPYPGWLYDITIIAGLGRATSRHQCPVVTRLILGGRALKLGRRAHHCANFPPKDCHGYQMYFGFVRRFTPRLNALPGLRNVRIRTYFGMALEPCE